MKSIFVYNPQSGQVKIKQHLDFILHTLRQKYGDDIDCVETEYAGHAYEIAKTKATNYDYFFVSGGDGTLNEIINGMGSLEKKPIIGYIPTGTVNDVSRSLGISRNIKKAVRNLVEGEPFKHDIFQVNNTYGIYICCAGIFTNTSYTTERHRKKKFGKIAYVRNALKDIAKLKPLPITLTTEDEVIKTNSSLIMILNSKSLAGFKLNKSADLNDGVVEVVIFKSHKKHILLADINNITRAFVFGLNSIKKSKNVIYLKLDKFNIVLDEGIPINLDGEKSGSGSFDFKVHKEAIQIIVPHKR